MYKDRKNTHTQKEREKIERENAIYYQLIEH